MKNKFLVFKRWFISLVLVISLTLCLGISTFAEENYGENIGTSGDNLEILPTEAEKTEENTPLYPENENESGDKMQNIFDEIYNAAESNADKIFSILAFIGTLVVGVGYKSGLMPLLRDALSKLKSAIDGVKADGELTKAENELKLKEISSAIESINLGLSKIEYQAEDYKRLLAERNTMKALLTGQIDMLYAIFMSSALPQYQKDEVGLRIQEMREVLASYENSVE